jgi:hypothetical protein
VKTKLITLALLVTIPFAANAQFPGVPKELKGLTDAISQQVAPAQKKANQSPVPTVQPVVSVADIKLGTYVGVYKGKQFKDQFIIIKAANQNQLSFYVETVDVNRMYGEVEGVAKLRGDVFLHASSADSNEGKCQITFYPKGNKLIVTQDFSCGMSARSHLMEEYEFSPNYKPMISAERERLVAEKAKLEKTGTTASAKDALAPVSKAAIKENGDKDEFITESELKDMFAMRNGEKDPLKYIGKKLKATVFDDQGYGLLYDKSHRSYECKGLGIKPIKNRKYTLTGRLAGKVYSDDDGGKAIYMSDCIVE